MAIKKTDEQNYIDIANAIRTVNGSEETYTPGEMAAAIAEIEGDNVDVVTLEAANDFVLSDSDKTILNSHVEDGNFKILVKSLDGFIYEVPLEKYFIGSGSTAELHAAGVVCPPQITKYSIHVEISIYGPITSFDPFIGVIMIPIDNESTITIVQSQGLQPNIKGYFFPYNYRNRYVRSTGTLTSNNFKIIDRTIDANTGLPIMTSHYEYTVSSINTEKTRITMTRTEVAN